MRFANVTLFGLLANLVRANSSLRGSNGIDHQIRDVEANRFLEENQVATYLRAEIEYGDNVSSGPKRVDYVRFHDGTSYHVKNAPSGWQDGLASGKDRVNIPPGAVISSDGSIDVRGKRPDVMNRAFSRNLNGHDDDSATRYPEQGRNLASFLLGTKTVLAVRIILTDGEYDFATNTGLSNDIFGNGADLHNLKSQYAACSYSQLIFNKAPDRAITGSPAFPSKTTAISNGVVDIKVNLAKSAGEVEIWNAVTLEMNRVFGVSGPNELAAHVMYCMPDGVMSGIAWAWVDDWGSVYSNGWCNHLSTQMHEIGHNIGFGHANDDGGYNDQTGYMGYSYGEDDWPKMCFNGAKSWQTQWYSTKTRVVDPSAGGCFNGKLYGVASFGNSASSVVLVKINDDFFVAFNRQIGINSETQDGANQVEVTQQAAGSGEESELVATLSAGGVWNGVVGGRSISVTVLSIDLVSSPAFARVRIAESGNSCTPSVSPTAKPTSSQPTSRKPTSSPSSAKPTSSRPTSRKPTSRPTTAKPTSRPTTAKPTSRKPTSRPTTAKPTSRKPTWSPTTAKPTFRPSTVQSTPTRSPTTVQSISSTPSSIPTSVPTTSSPTANPSFKPTFASPSTAQPNPTLSHATSEPTLRPSTVVTTSSIPTFAPSTEKQPTSKPNS